ncbi:MAG: hypothetical protein RO469_14935 [Thermincola sp.]|nr:hypothetical protein [Thermincola sp.]MDT3703955.1 hypothetical protein [Thermincola sp.]
MKFTSDVASNPSGVLVELIQGLNATYLLLIEAGDLVAVAIGYKVITIVCRTVLLC